jgi:hypothetical protein
VLAAAAAAAAAVAAGFFCWFASPGCASACQVELLRLVLLKYFSISLPRLSFLPLAAAGTTRLLVTHQRQFLPGCDEVLVLRGGTVAYRGTYAELMAAGVPEAAAAQGELRAGGRGGQELGQWEGGRCCVALKQ